MATLSKTFTLCHLIMLANKKGHYKFPISNLGKKNHTNFENQNQNSNRLKKRRREEKTRNVEWAKKKKSTKNGGKISKSNTKHSPALQNLKQL